MTDDDYTIHPMDVDWDRFGLVAGTMIDLINGGTVVGPYCEWPKRYRRQFLVTGVDNGSIACKLLDQEILNEFRSAPVIVGMDLASEPDRNIEITLTPDPVYMDRAQIYNINENKFKTLKRIDRCNSWEFDQPVLKKIKRKKDWQHRYPWEK